MDIFAWIVLILVFLIYIVLGNITLSRETITHRRNLLVYAFAVLIAEAYGAKLDPDFINTTISNNQLNSILKGILASLSVSSVIQYTYCFYGDLIGAIEKFRTLKLYTLLAFPVGIFRVFFDIILPVLACLFVLLICKLELVQFTQAIGRYVGHYVMNDTIVFPKIGPDLKEYARNMISYSQEDLCRIFGRQYKSDIPTLSEDGNIIFIRESNCIETPSIIVPS